MSQLEITKHSTNKKWFVLVILIYCAYCLFSYFYYSKEQVENRIKPMLSAGYKYTDFQKKFGLIPTEKTKLQRYCGSLRHDGLVFGDSDAQILNPHGEVPMASTGGRGIYGSVAHLNHGQIPIIPILFGYYTRTDLCFSEEGILAGYQTRRSFNGILYSQFHKLTDVTRTCRRSKDCS
jgi:hypothetical protein